MVENRHKYLNRSLESSITSYIFGSDDINQNISIVDIDFEDTIIERRKTSKISIGERFPDTQLFTNRWINRHLRNENIRSIKALRRIHLLLHNIVKYVNKSFGLQIMLAFISSAVMTTLNVHICIIALTKDREISSECTTYKFMSLQLAWTIPPILKLIGSTAACEMAKKEAARTAVLVQKLMLRQNLDPEVIHELQLFSQQLLHVDTKFTAFGFFVLDFSFLYSTIGSIVTFLIVLTQVWESYIHKIS
ncbi:hypothetical protein ANN_15517 [Periplaneta americana]|uniref:Gustatory receptor n=1 Tax=Periplaneta americana TaxID=6978 RepID=A0ABQ8SGK8_PERAM|nr:hypothetical protein ANN_15517 [Periplaneta americana]